MIIISEKYEVSSNYTSFLRKNLVDGLPLDRIPGFEFQQVLISSKEDFRKYVSSEQMRIEEE